MEDIIIIDDCMSKKWCDDFEKTLLETNFPWYYSRSANYGDNELVINWQGSLKNNPCVTDTPQFTHSFMHSDGSLSKAFPLVINLLTVTPFVVDRLLRIKGNITLPSGHEIKNTGIPHTDYLDQVNDIITCIYYVNDSDGDTVIFNEFNDGTKSIPNLTVAKKVSPKKGRMVIFDGNRFHAGSNPVSNNARCVININFTAYYKDDRTTDI